MKDKIFGVLQRVGRSFMLPIAILPVAGLFLGIGGSLTNETMLETYGLLKVMGEGTVLNAIFTVMSKAGSIVFDNLPLLFAMGVAIGMAKKEKEVAALSAALAFLIMHASIGAMIDINGGTKTLLEGASAQVLGITSLQMGVFGGIIVGLGVAALHNRFYKIELPQVLSFFGGTRFVPIISTVVYLVVGIAMYFIWPTIQSGIYQVGDLVLQSGYAGTWIYGVMERALIPFGLHHVFYMPFWQTAVGGSATVAGTVVEGAQNIFFAELAAPNITHFSVSATRFMSGKFPLMIFGLPGAALAMYTTAKSNKKKVVGGLLLSAALTSMLTGITEPIEFTFLFVAPILYVIHCVLAGLAYMFMHILGVGVGMTFSGGLIDLFLFGILQGNGKTSWIYIVIVGIFYFIIYYFLFRFLILKFNFKTPGRDDDTEETKLYTRADVNARKNNTSKESGAVSAADETSVLITRGLGGKANISDLDCCATRLRTTVYDASLVDEQTLKASGAAGVIKKGNGIQVIYGPKVTVIKSNLEDFLHTPESDHVMEHKAPVSTEAATKKEENKKSGNTETVIYSPLEGKVMSLKEVGDGVFSEELLGKGIAVEPSNGTVKAPFDGEVMMVFDTKHAIGLRSDSGVEVLIHIGIDTVQMNGKPFEVKVESGQKVSKGDILVKADLKAITDAGYRTVTPVIVSNTENYEDIVTTATGKVTFGDGLVKVK
ncbi:glucose PTS transporter subunit IIA [Anaerosporobacter sp.]